MVESAGLENRYTRFGYRGFESRPLRQAVRPASEAILPRASRTWIVGEVPEWLNGRAWKARVPGNRNRGFESRPLRHEVPGAVRRRSRLENLVLAWAAVGRV